MVFFIPKAKGITFSSCFSIVRNDGGPILNGKNLFLFEWNNLLPLSNKILETTWIHQEIFRNTSSCVICFIWIFLRVYVTSHCFVCHVCLLICDTEISQSISQEKIWVIYCWTILILTRFYRKKEREREGETWKL